MQKETLTKENIKRDILLRLLPDVVLIPIIYLCLLVINKIIDWILRGYHVTILININFILFIILTIASLYYLTYNLIMIYKTRKYQFIIKTSVLIGKDTYSRRIGSTSSTYYTLYFNRFIKYYIPDYWNYKWSSFHCMDRKGVFDSSNVDDKFLLISLIGKKVIMAYNLNFFDFQE